ncbi:hypothetical protein LZ496_07000 [Sphingomonas sp. NSE70-1]|uniref:Uncharacterized protein n=1 Tax=Sphingomonas caseinilyticus TaxID=2908205 RepID=A0ABT0RUA0_9SPHN|nr:hypothetical protein [Sphingomonas caseinilyticus]MCL6698531.1 hypothetical protein [Sphingomonas caseinilyticus]
MIKLLANAATAISLMLSASVAAPAWSADKSGSSKCHHSKKVAKRSTATIKAAPVRSVALVEKRKLDVQILSFGP